MVCFGVVECVSVCFISVLWSALLSAQPSLSVPVRNASLALPHSLSFSLPLFSFFLCHRQLLHLGYSTPWRDFHLVFFYDTLLECAKVLISSIPDRPQGCSSATLSTAYATLSFSRSASLSIFTRSLALCLSPCNPSTFMLVPFAL